LININLAYIYLKYYLMAVKKSRKSIIKKKNKLNYKLKNYKVIKNYKFSDLNYILKKHVSLSNKFFIN